MAIVNAGLKASPGSVDLLQLRTYYLTDADRLQEALADVDEAIRQQPQGRRNFQNRAWILRKLGRYDEALAAIDEAWRIDPLAADIIDGRIEILKKLDRRTEAMQLYDTWVAQDLTGQAYNSRCWSRAVDNVELAAAERDCEEAIKLKRQNAMAPPSDTIAS
jgi:tetratricopeptide (TPR) repeat protein